MRPKLLLAIALSAAALLRPCSSHAQDAASAKAFLVSVYQHYQHGAKGIDFDGPGAGLYYHSSLLSLIRADIKANGPDNVPAVDFDPVCGCQDWDGIWDLRTEIQMASPKRVLASISFALNGPKDRASDSLRKLEFTLVPERGGWRIYDILDESDPHNTFALRKLIEDDLATLRQSSGQKPSP